MKRHFLKFISTCLLLLFGLAATASGSDCSDALLQLNFPPNLAQAFQWLVLDPIARKAAREHLDTKNLGDVNHALLNAFLRMGDSYDESFELYKAFGASPNPYAQSLFNEQTQARVFFPAAILDSFFPQWHNLEPQEKWLNYVALSTSHLLRKVSDQALIEATHVRLPQFSGRTPGPREGFEQLIAKVIMEFNSELANRPLHEKLPYRDRWTHFEKSVEARGLSRGGSEDGLEAGGFFQALFGQSSVPPYFAVYNGFIDAVIGLDGDKLHLEISKKYQLQELEGEQTYFNIGYEGVSSSYADLKIAMQHLALKKGSHVVDIGSGYGRPGAVVGLYYPELLLRGFEIVPERVEIANRVARANGFTNVSFETTNLVENPEKIPAADVYFFYEPAKAHTLEKILEAIHKISRSREAPVRLVVRGATGVILPLLTEQNWLVESDRIYANGKFLYYVFSSRIDVTTPKPTYFESVSVHKLSAIDDRSMERWLQVLLAQPPPVVATTMSAPIYRS